MRDVRPSTAQPRHVSIVASERSAATSSSLVLAVQTVGSTVGNALCWPRGEAELIAIRRGAQPRYPSLLCRNGPSGQATRPQVPRERATGRAMARCRRRRRGSKRELVMSRCVLRLLKTTSMTIARLITRPLGLTMAPDLIPTRPSQTRYRLIKVQREWRRFLPSLLRCPPAYQAKIWIFW